MTPFSTAVSIAINARMSSEAKDKMRAHAGASVGLRMGFARMCFRIGKDGHWHPVSPLIEADVEMQHSPAGDIQISGSGALLKDLNEIASDWSPQKAVYEFITSTFGSRAAENAADAFSLIKELPNQCGFAPSRGEVSEFNQQTAEVSQKTAALEERLSRLENAHVR